MNFICTINWFYLFKHNSEISFKFHFRRVLHLIKQWLECAMEETDKRGRKTRTTEARDKAVVALSVYSRLDTNGGSYCTPSAKYRVGLRAISRAARNWA